MRPIYTVLSLLAMLFSIHLSSQTLTYGDVFDFEVGDIFHYEKSDPEGPQDPMGRPHFIKHEITDKYYSVNGDTLFYVQKWDRVRPQFCQQCTINRYSGIDTIWYRKPLLNRVISGGPVPIWDSNNCMSNWSSFTGRWTSTVADRCDSISIQLDTEQADSCQLSFPFYFNKDKAIYTKGMGRTYYRFNHCGFSEKDCYYTMSLIYFKRGNKSCGTPAYLLTSLQPDLAISKLKIFPNPVNTDLTIQTDGAFISSVIMYDILGNEVLRTLPKSPNLKLNLQGFETGIYIISISQNNLPPSFHTVVKQ